MFIVALLKIKRDRYWVVSREYVAADHVRYIFMKKKITTIPVFKSAQSNMVGCNVLVHFCFFWGNPFFFFGINALTWTFNSNHAIGVELKKTKQIPCLHRPHGRALGEGGAYRCGISLCFLRDSTANCIFVWILRRRCALICFHNNKKAMAKRNFGENVLVCADSHKWAQEGDLFDWLKQLRVNSIKHLY